MRLLIIIPAYNEEENIERVVTMSQEICPEYDYIIINDGSRDETARICYEQGYHVANHLINLGLSGAFRTGMRYAHYKHYDAAVQLDGDGQHRPEYLKRMLQEIEAGHDVVIGSRFLDQKKSFGLRMMGSDFIGWLIKRVTGQQIADPTSGLRMYSSQVIEEFVKDCTLRPEPDGIARLIQAGTNVKEIPVKMEERITGQSYLTLGNSVRYMITTTFGIVKLRYRKEKKS